MLTAGLCWSEGRVEGKHAQTICQVADPLKSSSTASATAHPETCTSSWICATFCSLNNVAGCIPALSFMFSIYFLIKINKCLCVAAKHNFRNNFEHMYLNNQIYLATREWRQRKLDSELCSISTDRTVAT